MKLPGIWRRLAEGFRLTPTQNGRSPAEKSMILRAAFARWWINTFWIWKPIPELVCLRAWESIFPGIGRGRPMVERSILFGGSVVRPHENPACNYLAHSGAGQSKMKRMFHSVLCSPMISGRTSSIPNHAPSRPNEPVLFSLAGTVFPLSMDQVDRIVAIDEADILSRMRILTLEQLRTYLVNERATHLFEGL